MKKKSDKTELTVVKKQTAQESVQERLKDECRNLMKYSATIEDALIQYGINNDTIVEGIKNDIRRLETEPNWRTDLRSITELRHYREMLIRLIGGFAPERKITANIEYKWVEGNKEKE